MANETEKDEAVLTVRIPAWLHADLLKFCEREDRSLAWTIRFALREFVSREGLN